MDSHLISVPSISTFSAWTLSCGNSQASGWESDWSFYFDLVVLGFIDDVTASVINRFYVQASDCQSISQKDKYMIRQGAI